jgi:hypothetical protein
MSEEVREREREKKESGTVLQSIIQPDKSQIAADAATTYKLPAHQATMSG